MIRSVSFCRVIARLKIPGQETCRIIQQFQPLCIHYSAKRYIQTSNIKFADDSKSNVAKGKGKRKKGSSAQKSRMVNNDVEAAAVNAAKSLPGDWNKTAEELLDRLRMHQSPAVETPAASGKQSSLLSTMHVGKSLDSLRKGRRGRGSRANQTEDDENDLYSKSTVTTIKRPYVARRPNELVNLHGEPRLNIFDAEEIKKQTQEQASTPTDGEDLWHRVGMENLRKVKGYIPNNGFEEMVQWTKEGRLWQFPIDNEIDMEEEKKYKFHDHVFLEHHLSNFPDKGPIRKFMELVVLGLSKNPWLSVPEKVEHIQWFAEYFQEKQDVLEHAIGEQGLMKSEKKKIESKS